MRSSNRIIRGLDAAELPSWSVDLIGDIYQNPVERMMSDADRQRAKNAQPAKPLSAEETRLKEWEDALARREAQLKLLERDTLKEAEEKGLQTGYEAGWNTAHNERVALLQATKSMEDEFERFKLELSDKLLDLAVLVSKKVIADTVTLQPQQAALLLNQVLDSTDEPFGRVVGPLGFQRQTLADQTFWPPRGEGDRGVILEVRALLRDRQQQPFSYVIESYLQQALP